MKIINSSLRSSSSSFSFFFYRREICRSKIENFHGISPEGAGRVIHYAHGFVFSSFHRDDLNSLLQFPVSLRGKLAKEKRAWERDTRDNGITRRGDIKFSVGLAPPDLSILKRNPKPSPRSSKCIYIYIYTRCIGTKQFAPWNRRDGYLEARKIRVLLFYRGSRDFSRGIVDGLESFSRHEITRIPCFFRSRFWRDLWITTNNTSEMLLSINFSNELAPRFFSIVRLYQYQGTISSSRFQFYSTKTRNITKM